MKTPREVLLKKHEAVEGKLDQMWRATLRRGLGGRADATERIPPIAKLWRELIWPCRRVWAGLACAWVLIAVLNLASAEPEPRSFGKTAPPSHEEIRALVEQRRMLAQLIGEEPKPTEKQRTDSSGPRSERMSKLVAA